MMDRREARVECVKVLLGMGYEWLARDKDGTALCYDKKPFKIDDDEWSFDDEHQYLYLDNSDDINFVKWEDEEPVNIREWLKKEEEEMKNRREARYASVALLLGSGYLWLARDLNGSIAAYSHKPFKLDDECWYYEIGESKDMWMWVDDGDLYNFVKWEDEEPVNIREWLEKEEEEMKMYSVKDGELECREVDADFFEKNTTLGGLLTPRELDRDNNIIPDDATIKVNSENSGHSAFYEMGEKFREGLKAGIDYGYEPSVAIVADQDDRKVAEGATIKVTAEKANAIREALEMATDYGYKPSVLIVDDNYTLKTNGQILDFKSMYPKPLSLADLDNVKVHDRICLELNNIYEKKNADYGNSFENSLDKHGMIAGIVRMDDKMSRLISLNSKNEQLVLDESMRDTLMDLANYAIMSVMWLDEQ